MVFRSPALTYRDQNYPDYRLRITEPDNRFGVRIRIHDGLMIDQDLPYSHEDKFSRDKIKNNHSAL